MTPKVKILRIAALIIMGFYWGYLSIVNFTSSNPSASSLDAPLSTIFYMLILFLAWKFPKAVATYFILLGLWLLVSTEKSLWGIIYSVIPLISAALLLPSGLIHDRIRKKTFIPHSENTPIHAGNTFQTVNPPTQQTVIEEPRSRSRKILLYSAGGCLGLILLLIIVFLGLYWFGVFGGTSQQVDVEPAFSPDGSMIAFTSYRKGNRDIYVMKSDGSGMRQLTSDPLAMFSPFNNFSDISPDWSPDGKHIIFASARENDKMSYTAFDLFVMNPDGSDVQKWWVSNYYETDSLDYHPAWSPDGNQIVFCSDGNGSDRNILVAKVEKTGSAPKQLTGFRGSNVDYPAWSPDGRKIAFGMNKYDSDQHDIYVIDLSGNSNRITKGNHPAWSPDGQKIAFSRIGSKTTDIFVINADGTGELQLTKGAGANTSPNWSPDGKKIAFSSSRDGNTYIYVMNIDGSNVVQISH